MMQLELLMNEARDAGFTLVAPLDVSTIDLRDEVREMCAVNKCHAYNTNWSCPPGCGTVEECRRRIATYTDGFVVQTTAQLEDDFDFETMAAASAQHGKNFVAFLKKLRSEHPELEVLPLGTGECINCKKCTYPDAPCRFPELMSSPMEGYGMVISDVCKKNNIPYHHGRGTLTYVACYLLREGTSCE